VVVQRDRQAVNRLGTGGIRFFRLIGAGIITGAADDDPSAIGTYASVGAKFGLAFLWIAPVVLPMMFVVTYLAAKLGRVYGKGLFATVTLQFFGSYALRFGTAIPPGFYTR
jgi:Mn2+/Fe2+ NRAMP family transporter